MFSILEDIRYYGYGKITNDRDIFSKTTTGVSFYDDILNEPDYMEKNKNLVGKIVMMTPTKYFEECGKIFNSNAQKSLNMVKADTEVTDELKSVVLDYRYKLSMPYLNYASNEQEGRHRMYIAGELLGWNTPQPVLIVDYADKERAQKDLQAQEIKATQRKIREAVQDALKYRYKDFDDFKEQLQWSLDREFDKEVEFSLSKSNDEVIVEVDYVEYTFDYDDIIFKLEDEPDDLPEFTDEEIEELSKLDIDELLNRLS